MTHYSQYEEQEYILRACGYIESGRFLDIGAFHPRVFSNTRALFELGWSGVMFEPSPRPMLDLLAEYGNEPRVTLVSAAVGMESVTAKMHVTDDCVSTVDTEMYDRLKESSRYIGSFLVQQFPLERISVQFGHFDFINFDAEGLSADLFIQALKLGWRPRCICVEHDYRLTELAECATQCGYSLIMANGTNGVFAA